MTTCKLCGNTTHIPDDLEDTGICNLCAQEHFPKLRKALAGLVGATSKKELEAMEFVLRSAPAPDEDKAHAINAIHALIATAPL